MRTKKEIYTDISIFIAVALFSFILGYFYSQQQTLERCQEVMHSRGLYYDSGDLTYIATGENL